MFSDSTAGGAATPRTGSSGEALRLLVVDENPRDRALIVESLRAGLPGCRLVEIEDPSSIPLLIDAAAFDVVVTDHRPFGELCQLVIALEDGLLA